MGSARSVCSRTEIAAFRQLGQALGQWGQAGSTVALVRRLRSVDAGWGAGANPNYREVCVRDIDASPHAWIARE
jgi:hypothetical protein